MPHSKIGGGVTELQPFGAILDAADRGDDLRAIPVEEIEELTLRHRVLVLRGLDMLPKEDLIAYCRGWGDLVEWHFGHVLDLDIREDPQNYLFTRGDVPFHWDGAFAASTPRFFLFQCLQAPPADGGGETVFSDTAQVLREATASDIALWEKIRITYRTDKVEHYGGQVTEPLLATHPATGERTIRFAEPLPPEQYLNPLFLSVEGVSPEEGAAALEDLTRRLHDPRVCYAHEWRDNDIVVVDNNALVHGRNPFRGESTRRLQRVQII